jgi:hypothetical protein
MSLIKPKWYHHLEPSTWRRNRYRRQRRRSIEEKMAAFDAEWEGKLFDEETGEPDSSMIWEMERQRQVRFEAPLHRLTDEPLLQAAERWGVEAPTLWEQPDDPGVGKQQ